MKLFFGFLIACILTLPALAQVSGLPQDFYAAPTGFKAITHNTALPKVSSVQTPGNKPNWVVSCYGCAANFPPFNSSYHTETKDAGFSFNPVDKSFKVLLSSKNDSCTATYVNAPVNKTQVKETDEFASTNQNLIKGLPLSKMENFLASFTFTVYPAGPFSTSCPYDVVNVLYSVSLINSVTKQNLMYQITLAHYGSSNGSPLIAKPSAIAWFETGSSTQDASTNVFGYGDNLHVSYNQPLPHIGLPTDYNFDILPRLEAVIADGAANHGLNGDLSQWYFDGVSIGPTLFGNASAMIKVANWSLQVTPK